MTFRQVSDVNNRIVMRKVIRDNSARKESWLLGKRCFEHKSEKLGR